MTVFRRLRRFEPGDLAQAELCAAVAHQGRAAGNGAPPAVVSAQAAYVRAALGRALARVDAPVMAVRETARRKHDG